MTPAIGGLDAPAMRSPSSRFLCFALVGVIGCSESPAERDAPAPLDVRADTPSDAGDCDPTEPSVALPDFGATLADPIVLVPSELDPATDRFPGATHRVYLPAAGTTVRDELFVFLPGTGNHPAAFDRLARIAAHAGYRVLVLAWDSERHPSEYCLSLPLGEQEACRTAVFHEKAYGQDRTPVVDIDEADSVVGRAVRVLEAIEARLPGGGAATYLDGGSLAWDRLVLAGFSQGAVMVGYLSRDHAVARAVLLAGGCDSVDVGGTVRLAAWCTSPRATPADRTWALRHVSDEPEEDRAIHEAYGLFAFGDYLDVGAASPAYCSGTHLFETSLPSTGDGTRYHLSVAHDDYLPVDAGGVPILAEDYFYLFTAE